MVGIELLFVDEELTRRRVLTELEDAPTTDGGIGQIIQRLNVLEQGNCRDRSPFHVQGCHQGSRIGIALWPRSHLPGNQLMRPRPLGLDQHIKPFGGWHQQGRDLLDLIDGVAIDRDDIERQPGHLQVVPDIRTQITEVPKLSFTWPHCHDRLYQAIDGAMGGTV